MPKLWDETIEAHRRTVHTAILDTTVELVAERGLLAVTMSQIAEKTGIGRATLYKYFPDVESILLAWHSRQIAGHLERLARVREQKGDPGRRLESMLQTYALIHHQMARHGRQRGFGPDLIALLHRSEDVVHTQHQLRDMMRDALIEAAAAGEVRGDVPADELAAFCLHALQAAAAVPSKAAVQRLVALTLAGLRAC